MRIDDGKTWRLIGFNFALGAVQLVVLWLVVVLVVALTLDALGLRERDSTDSPTERSNMYLRTDHGTGCQYLESVDGGITPRLAYDGSHICGEVR